MRAPGLATRWSSRRLGGNLFARHDQQHVVADDDRRAFVGHRQLVGEPLAHFDPKAADDGGLFLGEEQSDRAVRAPRFCHLQQGAVAAANVEHIVVGAKFDLAHDAFLDATSDGLLVFAAQGEVLDVVEMARGFAAIFHVVFGTGDHRTVE